MGHDEEVKVVTNKLNTDINKPTLHSSVNEYQCSYNGCLKIFGKKSRLVYHERTHTGEKPFKCDIDGCQNCYKRKSHLERHKLASHDINRKKENFSCDKCSKVYQSIYSLKKHQSNCQSDLPYQCLKCSSCFKKENQLTKHQFIHTGLHPFPCPQDGCEKRFLLKSRLNEHMKTHLKKYICPYDTCDEIFNLYSILRHHLTIAHKKKCDFCEEEFTRLSQLTRHLSTYHSESREAFFCPYTPCERYYFDEKNLIVHIQSNHNKTKSYTCYVCDRNFVTKQTLIRHMNNIHYRTEEKAIKVSKVKKKPRKDKGVSKTDYWKLLSGYVSDDGEEISNSIGENVQCLEEKDCFNLHPSLA